MKNVKIHPLFLLVTAVCLACGRALILVNTLVAVIIHEWAHIAVARARGYEMSNITLMPYGGSITAIERISSADDVYISLMGPMSNLLISVIGVAMWWVVPESYYFTNKLVSANLAIGLFNLLPAYPLDASRVILATAKNKAKALKALRWVGCILGVISLGFFVASIFFSIAPSLAIVGGILIISATKIIDKEERMNSISRVGIIKNWSEAIDKRCVIVDVSLPLARLLRLITPTAIISYEVVDGGELIRVASEAEVIEWSAIYPRNTRIRDIIYK